MEVKEIPREKWDREKYPTFARDFDRADAELENCGRCEGRTDICPNATKGYRTVIVEGYDHWPNAAIRPCQEMLKVLAARKMEARLSAAGLGQKFWNRTFDRFNVSADNQAAYAAAKKYAATYRETHRWLLFYGDAGRGKTHLATAVVIDAIERGESPLVVRSKDAIYQLHESYQTNTTEQYRDELNTAPLLLLDDIGEENDKDKEFIAAVIKSRYEAERPTIITTNLKPKRENESDPPGLIEKYGPAIFSRFEEVCDVVRMQGPDYRVKGVNK
jgi:DNA replication protein DnaC